MEKKTSSISSFKVPVGFLAALLALICTSTVVGIVAYQESWPNQLEDEKAALGVIDSKKRFALVVLGDSRSALHFDIVSSELGYKDSEQILLLATPAATPRAHLAALEYVDWKVRPDFRTMLIFVTPVGLNRNNDVFLNTVGTFFTSEEIFTELILRGRYREIVELIFRKSPIDLINYRWVIRSKIAHGIQILLDSLKGAKGRGFLESYDFQRGKSLEEKERTLRALKSHSKGKKIPDKLNRSRQEKLEREIVEHKRRKRELLNLWKTRFLKDYAIDQYQVNALRSIIHQAGMLKIEPGLVMVPISPELREIIGNKNMKHFVDLIYDIGSKTNTPVFDYVTFPSNSQWEFRDSIHLDSVSNDTFSALLASDISQFAAGR